MWEAYLVGREAIMKLNDCYSISSLTFGEPRLREDLVGTPLRHGETNELHRGPRFKCFDAISHQCIPRDLYRLILQPVLVDKILRCNDTTRCTVLEKVKASKWRRYCD